jgi:hypothetical protein
MPSLDWKRHCIYFTCIYIAVICKTVSSGYAQGIGVKFKVKVTLQLVVYRQSVFLDPRPLETHEQVPPPHWTFAVIVLRWHSLWCEDGFVSYEYAQHFIKCTYHIYSMLFKILSFPVHTSPLSVQALQRRSYLSYVFYAIFSPRYVASGWTA